jgi:hypothetical protein
MKKILFLSSILFVSQTSQAQNVGIGTNLPNGKLHINGYSTGAVPSLLITDSTLGNSGKIIFKNNVRPTRFFSFSGYTFADDAAESYFDVNSDAATIATFRGNGNVGIGINTPANKLDVAGDVNFTGALKANYNPGASGQLLQSNGSGASPTWVSITNAGMTNHIRYNHTGAVNTQTNYSFTVPPDITKIFVEAWGGGGGAESNDIGAGGGAYVAAYENVSPGQIIIILVGGGGKQQTVSGFTPIPSTNGQSSLVNFTPTREIIAGGGGRGISGSGLSTCGAGGIGTFSAGMDAIVINGNAGIFTKREILHPPTSPTTIYDEYRAFASGGDAGNAPNTGRIGLKSVAGFPAGTTVYQTLAINAMIPGGGASDNLPGAAGMVFIHY